MEGNRRDGESRTVKEEAGKFGLEVNMEKSKCMMFNVEVGGEEVQKTEGMKVVQETNYLGVKIERRFNLYKGQRRTMLEKGKMRSNMTYSVLWWERCTGSPWCWRA